MVTIHFLPPELNLSYNTLWHSPEEMMGKIIICIYVQYLNITDIFVSYFYVRIFLKIFWLVFDVKVRIRLGYKNLF